MLFGLVSDGSFSFSVKIVMLSGTNFLTIFFVIHEFCFILYFFLTIIGSSVICHLEYITTSGLKYIFFSTKWFRLVLYRLVNLFCIVTMAKKIMFDKIMCYEFFFSLFADGFFYFSIKLLYRIPKTKYINRKTAFFLLSLQNPVVSFHFNLLSTAFEKVCGGGIFDPYFWSFSIFSKTTLTNLNFWFQCTERVMGTSHE